MVAFQSSKQLHTPVNLRFDLERFYHSGKLCGRWKQSRKNVNHTNCFIFSCGCTKYLKE